MEYTQEVQNMCSVCKGAKHEPAPIPEAQLLPVALIITLGTEIFLIMTDLPYL